MGVFEYFRGLRRSWLPMPGEEPVNEEIRLRRKADCTGDLYAVGHFLLFLLYSAYPDTGENERRGWLEQLELSGRTRSLLRKPLQSDPPYESATAFVEAAHDAWRRL